MRCRPRPAENSGAVAQGRDFVVAKLQAIKKGRISAFCGLRPAGEGRTQIA
jgi:hypothetical protein